MQNDNNRKSQPMTKAESKYFNTALLMDQALVSLLETKAYEYITIKEICEKAGVNRSTFYLHYDNISDLLAETMENINQKLFDYYDMDASEFIHSVTTASNSDLIIINREFLTPYLQFVQDNKKIFIAASKNPTAMNTSSHFNNIKKYIIKPIMEKFEVPAAEQDYWIAFYMYGVNAIINEWINNECNDSIDNVITAIIHCVRPHS